MRILREPLVHFFALGAALFVVYGMVSGRSGDRAEHIVVMPGHVEHLASGFERTWLRPPTERELDGLVEDWIRDEIYYREALVLGIDRDDTVVRRRLRQKMEFLTEETTAPFPPPDKELAQYLETHADRFQTEPRVTFRQVYLRPDATAAAADALLARLAAAGAEADVARLGDPIMLPQDMALAPRSEIARLFGQDFAARLTELEPGRWAGPVPSGYGLHLVLVRARADARVPPLADVRDAVEREWRAERRRQLLEAAYQGLRGRYTIVIERPAAHRLAEAK